MKIIMTIIKKFDGVQIAGWLMIISAIAHVSQLLFLGTQNPETVNGAIYGSSFVIVGWLLLTRPHIGLWLGVIWPALLGSGAVYRIVKLDPTFLTYVFAMVDVVVVTLCLFHLIRKLK